MSTEKTENNAPLNPTDETRPMMIHVVAPSSLPAGYTFEAEINGDKEKVITCVVPSGGIDEGQVFLTPLPQNYNGPRLSAPVGHWKDGLFEFFNAGFFHPSFWCSWFCTQIAMGQVMSRMTLTWLGAPGTITTAKQTFCVVVTLTVSYILYATFLDLAISSYDPNYVPPILSLAKSIGNLLFMIWSICALTRTRQAVRARYQIPEQHCQGCEDICCAVWCGCCTTAQMLRHTGDYETYPGSCCTATGHPPDTPLSI